MNCFMLIMNFLKYNSIGFLIYLLYLELNPKITGIWLRRDSNNNYFIALSSLLNFILYPIKNKQLWYPYLWDMNIFIAVPIISGTLFIINKYNNSLLTE